MVMFGSLCSALAVAAQVQKPLWLRLEPSDRLRALAALAVVLILGFAFAAFAVWGARWTRRYMAGAPRSDRLPKPHPDDWARKPLLPPDRSPAADEDRT